ncbi:reverse transcriptase domain-containing protein [Tanacetum coccineum]
MDVFAWQPSDLIGVPRRVIKHALNVNASVTPVAQKLRVLGSEKNWAVIKKVEEWVKSRIIKQMKYPTWISNPMLIKKGDDTWRMWEFLGYMVTSEGIRANPKKTKAVADMQALKTLKGIEKKEPIDGRKTRSVYFIGVGKVILELRTLTTPEPKAILYVYLATSCDAVSGVLIADRKGKQIPICLTDDEKSKEWTLYTDEESSLKGVGVGLVLIDPSDTEYTYAIRLTFPSINNKAEYKALLAGLRIARKMKLHALKVKVDSKLVAYQMNGEFVASSEGMEKYLTTTKEHATLFKRFLIENIPRNQNQKADVLRKLASFTFNHLTKEILVQVLNTKFVDTQEVKTIMEEEEDNWMTPIIKCLKGGIRPTYKNKARALRTKISQYVIEEGVLFNKSYLSPMLRCVGPLQENYIIRELHEGACRMHAKARSVVEKIMRQGYYWPTMHRDTKEVVDKCDSCQIHARIPRLPKIQLNSIMSPWPFNQWGLDILEPLPEDPGKLMFIIMVIDYFTKWMEAKPLA